MLFLQCLEHHSTGVQEHEANIQDEHAHINETKTVSQALNEMATEMQVATPYRTIKLDEPPICPEPTTFSSSTESLNARGALFMPLLVRT